MIARRPALVAISAATAGALALSGCVNNAKSNSPGPSSSGTVGAVSKNEAAAALLPASIKSAGKLRVGINVPYQPNEYRDTSTNQIVGWEVDMLDAAAKDLGVTTQYVPSGFDTILPSVKGNKFDLGMSSFTDTKEREQNIDFVNYYTAGIQWATPNGKTIDPSNACGLKVAVETGTTEQIDDLPAKSKACTAAGKKPINILKIDSQDAVNQSVILGQADAFDADSPITEYAVKQSKGKLQLDGDIYGAAPYGLAVAKTNSGLTQALQKAIQDLMDNGTYKQILAKWGVEAGAIDKATINGASS